MTTVLVLTEVWRTGRFQVFGKFRNWFGIWWNRKHRKNEKITEKIEEKHNEKANKLLKIHKNLSRLLIFEKKTLYYGYAIQERSRQLLLSDLARGFIIL